MDFEFNDISGIKVMMRPFNITYTGTSDLGRYYFRKMLYCIKDNKYKCVL